MVVSSGGTDGLAWDGKDSLLRSALGKLSGKFRETWDRCVRVQVSQVSVL